MIVAVVSIIVLLATADFLGQTAQASLTKLKHDARIVQDASDKYFLDYG